MKTIEIIGVGVMGGAIARVLSKRRAVRLVLHDRNLRKAKTLAKRLGVRTDGPDYQLLSQADFVILAVKPQDYASLAPALKGKLRSATVLISIAAGMTIRRVQQLFGHRKVVRVMPNLGLAVGHGVAAWLAARSLSQAELRRAKRLLDCISENFQVNRESLLDSVTAVSGSGPAYFFLLAASLEEAARSLGLSKTQSRKSIETTLRAAAALQEGEDYSVLISKIASKKGTTEAALRLLQQRRFVQNIKQAVKAAYLRAKELAK